MKMIANNGKAGVIAKRVSGETPPFAHFFTPFYRFILLKACHSRWRSEATPLVSRLWHALFSLTRFWGKKQPE
jgi:hypothetical protein